MKNLLKICKPWFISITSFSVLLLVCQDASAGTTIGTMASSIYKTFTNVGYAITGGSYVAGLAFSIGAIMKFKQHKDNPTQIPIGTPISLVFIAAALLFLPSILSVAGYTMFGAQGSTAGPTGMTITGS
ncbi:type IV secretion protein IcmD [Legionella sp. km772]|uniref:type IV secretion protein IcmD n=1 Tax=Legionella sp. km772 TaxID=2498111 RepID=UPI001F391E75|nr:type IV secretion protein IcmD [Legionella sp. km772]